MHDLLYLYDRHDVHCHDGLQDLQFQCDLHYLFNLHYLFDLYYLFNLHHLPALSALYV